jgi:uncharacterized protein DUF4031
MIVVDDIVEYPAKMTTDKGLPGRHWCHMISTLADLEAAEIELREMAVRIGIGAHRIQHQGRPTIHYDLTPALRDRAVRAGALEINAYEFARARLNGQAAVEALVSRKSAGPVVGATQPPAEANHRTEDREREGAPQQGVRRSYSTDLPDTLVDD